MASDRDVTRTLTLDMADPMAIVHYLAAATEDWTDERRGALGSDIGAMLDRGDGIDMHQTAEGMVAVASAEFLDILSRHGLTG
ncbi:hypothetical protein [Thauera sp.]|uniref:hypothetical protein n=1 Tax=Thauera sp. TaxID=1905334 RepID=UPI002BFFE63C|nr:hypothetical protein [Thauera sp.]HRP26039.1 hypothetical protein [Thauera sp.]